VTGTAGTATRTAFDPAAAASDSERRNKPLNPVALTARAGDLYGIIQADQDFKLLLANLTDIFIYGHFSILSVNLEGEPLRVPPSNVRFTPCLPFSGGA